MLVPVDEDDVASLLLQMQGRADTDHARTQHQNVSLRFRHPSLPSALAQTTKPLAFNSRQARCPQTIIAAVNRLCVAVKLWQHGSGVHHRGELSPMPLRQILLATATAS